MPIRGRVCQRPRRKKRFGGLDASQLKSLACVGSLRSNKDGRRILRHCKGTQMRPSAAVLYRARTGLCARHLQKNRHFMPMHCFAGASCDQRCHPVEDRAGLGLTLMLTSAAFCLIPIKLSLNNISLFMLIGTLLRCY